MGSSDRWRSNWTAVSPPGGVRVDVRRSPARRREAQRAVRELAAGTPVVLTAAAPRARARCTSFAAETGVGVEREYLAFPTAAAPAFLVEDSRASANFFVRAILVAPPRTLLSVPIEVGLVVLRALNPWRIVRLLAPGRLVVGRRV